MSLASSFPFCVRLHLAENKRANAIDLHLPTLLLFPAPQGLSVGCSTLAVGFVKRVAATCAAKSV